MLTAVEELKIQKHAKITVDKKYKSGIDFHHFDLKLDIALPSGGCQPDKDHDIQEMYRKLFLSVLTKLKKSIMDGSCVLEAFLEQGVEKYTWC